MQKPAKIYRSSDIFQHVFDIWNQKLLKIFEIHRNLTLYNE